MKNRTKVNRKRVIIKSQSFNIVLGSQGHHFAQSIFQHYNTVIKTIPWPNLIYLKHFTKKNKTYTQTIQHVRSIDNQQINIFSLTQKLNPIIKTNHNIIHFNKIWGYNHNIFSNITNHLHSKTLARHLPNNNDNLVLFHTKSIFDLTEYPYFTKEWMKNNFPILYSKSRCDFQSQYSSLGSYFISIPKFNSFLNTLKLLKNKQYQLETKNQPILHYLVTKLFPDMDSRYFPLKTNLIAAKQNPDLPAPVAKKSKTPFDNNLTNTYDFEKEEKLSLINVKVKNKLSSRFYENKILHDLITQSQANRVLSKTTVYKKNTSLYKPVDLTVKEQQSSISEELLDQVKKIVTKKQTEEIVRYEQNAAKPIPSNSNEFSKLADRVYKMIEKKLIIEKERRGMN